MGTIAEKLQYTAEAKADIQEAIIDQGQECPGDLPLADYADRIRAIEGGGGGGVNALPTFASIPISTVPNSAAFISTSVTMEGA